MQELRKINAGRAIPPTPFGQDVQAARYYAGHRALDNEKISGREQSADIQAPTEKKSPEAPKEDLDSFFLALEANWASRSISLELVASAYADRQRVQLVKLVEAIANSDDTAKKLQEEVDLFVGLTKDAERLYRHQQAHPDPHWHDLRGYLDAWLQECKRELMALILCSGSGQNVEIQAWLRCKFWGSVGRTVEFMRARKESAEALQE